MQSFKTIYHPLPQEISGRWSPPNIGNKSRKRKTWNMANKRSNKGGKENAQEDEKGDARLSDVRQAQRKNTQIRKDQRLQQKVNLRCGPVGMGSVGVWGWGILHREVGSCPSGPCPEVSTYVCLVPPGLLSFHQSPESSCFSLILSSVIIITLPDEADNYGNL